MIGWQWHQMDHMQIICTLLQTDNHASTSPLSFYRPDALPAAHPKRQSTEDINMYITLGRHPCKLSQMVQPPNVFHALISLKTIIYVYLDHIKENEG